jgi:hypothetical protein
MIDIDREHTDYKREEHTLRTYRDLYTGGEELKKRAAEYLLRRQKEPLDVYAERLRRVFYQNYIGSIVDWYSSTLFRREPGLQFDEGQATDHDFISKFVEDCDARGTTLSNFFRRCFIDSLVVGRSHILLDFPTTQQIPQTRAEEDAVGVSRAYLVRYSAEDLINWCSNERDEYEWIVLRQRMEGQPTVDSPEIVQQTFWRYYDRTEYRIYRRVEGGEKPAPITLVERGPHALAGQGCVPFFTLQNTPGLWLMNKAAHLQLEHFNKSNALAWAITMGLFAMPVIYSDREWNQIVGESYYIQLGPSDRFGWTEPDGKVFEIAAANLETLKDEIYRVCYLSEASGELTSGHAQSALSKQLDFTITQEVLRAYGASIKDCIVRVLRSISQARVDEVAFSVSGLDEVDITDFGTELQNAKSLFEMGINSPTLKREVCQRLAIKYLSDTRQETKDQIAREIQSQFSH